MALHTDLPIHKVTYDLCAHAARITKNMPRDFKQSLGGKIRDECVELVVMIFRANTAADKAPHLLSLLERLQVVELMLRLSRDLQCISTGQYATAIELTGNIGRQANGWRKSASPAASRSRP